MDSNRKVMSPVIASALKSQKKAMNKMDKYFTCTSRDTDLKRTNCETRMRGVTS